jgi:hypothetical protein
MKTTMSKLLSLNQWDLIKGAFLAAIVAILTALLQALQTSKIPNTWAEWSVILSGGLIAFISYILKNIFSNSEGKPLTKEATPPVVIAENKVV